MRIRSCGKCGVQWFRRHSKASSKEDEALSSCILGKKSFSKQVKGQVYGDIAYSLAPSYSGVHQ